MTAGYCCLGWQNSRPDDTDQFRKFCIFHSPLLINHSPVMSGWRCPVGAKCSMASSPQALRPRHYALRPRPPGADRPTIGHALCVWSRIRAARGGSAYNWPSPSAPLFRCTRDYRFRALASNHRAWCVPQVVLPSAKIQIDASPLAKKNMASDRDLLHPTSAAPVWSLPNADSEAEGFVAFSPAAPPAKRCGPPTERSPPGWPR